MVGSRKAKSTLLCMLAVYNAAPWVVEAADNSPRAANLDVLDLEQSKTFKHSFVTSPSDEQIPFNLGLEVEALDYMRRSWGDNSRRQDQEELSIEKAVSREGAVIYLEERARWSGRSLEYTFLNALLDEKLAEIVSKAKQAVQQLIESQQDFDLDDLVPTNVLELLEDFQDLKTTETYRVSVANSVSAVGYMLALQSNIKHRLTIYAAPDQYTLHFERGAQKLHFIKLVSGGVEEVLIVYRNRDSEAGYIMTMQNRKFRLNPVNWDIIDITNKRQDPDQPFFSLEPNFIDFGEKLETTLLSPSALSARRANTATQAIETVGIWL